MKELILVRYGQYENGHLTEEGKETMMLSGERIKNHLGTLTPLLISAPTSRAVESAKIIGNILSVDQIDTYPQIYAADEEDILPDCSTASKMFFELGKKNSVIVAIASREYIEELPSYILKSVLQAEGASTSLERGEALILNYAAKKVSYLK